MKKKPKARSPYAKDPSHQYRPWLAGLAARAERVVEVGVYQGRLTAHLARNIRATIWAVDHWQGPAAYPGIALEVNEKTERGFRKRLRPWIEAGRVVVVMMGSVEAAAALYEAHGAAFDVVFIDASHDYESVKADLAAWVQCVKPGGILCGHDINWPGVRKAVEEAFPDFYTGGGFCWWVEVENA